MANTKDMTKGSPARLIATFALPLMLGNGRLAELDGFKHYHGVYTGLLLALCAEFWSLQYE